MGKQVRAAAFYLDDVLGGMRQVTTITEISLSDNGGAEASFNTAGKLIGFGGYEGGYTLQTTIQYVADEPSEPNYWKLRADRTEVNVTVDFQGGDRVQFRGVLAKFEPKADNQGKVTAAVEWVLGEPRVLREGNGPRR